MTDIPEQDVYICQLPKGCGIVIDGIVFYLQDREQIQKDTDKEKHID